MKNKFLKVIYFVVIAPILAKCLEWVFIGSIAQNWIAQILFIVAWAIGLGAILTNVFREDLNKLVYVVGLSYFAKEIVNQMFYYNNISFWYIFAWTIEPIMMLLIFGFLPLKIMEWFEE